MSLKRIFDVVLVVLSVPVLVPVLLVLFIVVRGGIGSPVLFKQKRPGFQTQPFVLYKFRTMRNIYDEKGELLPDEKRLTGFGRFLRSTSLDELPEIYNVLTGTMSFVGPRPLLLEYLHLYTAEQVRRHEMKPGITGWAQVNGRNTLSWEERFRLDVWYVDNQSFLLDIKILAITVKQVLLRDGINEEGHATMTKFTGTE
ncbi:sugar transferase [Desulfocapsa sp. AH-315-G09]|nr:sugar transferase [Desulfocapsa sp.]MBN4063948.1 sugar transferase [bacterium AH-315-I07]MBN4063962.1 sugar transferase [bacterium AH-315-I07]MBN4065438.1 sugar transferase [Desulfocapsa sp. AH-315-G09]